MKILLVAGGTGGHFFPALSLIPLLKKKYASLNIMFILGKKRIEDTFVNHIPQDITVYRLRGSYWSWKSMTRIFAIMVNALQSLIIIIRRRPRIIILFGGYLSLFPGIWGRISGARIIIHEQNVIPGKVNGILARWAHEIWGSFEETEKYFEKYRSKFKHSGLPVRVSDVNNENKKTVPQDRKVILFMGGSQGADFINKLFQRLLENKLWRESFYSILIGGIKQQEKSTDDFLILSFCHDIHYWYRAADVVIARAGASTIAELLEMQVKGILIPYPYAYRNHQDYNARAAYTISGKNLMCLHQDEIIPDTFMEIIEKHITSKMNWNNNISFREEVLKGLV